METQKRTDSTKLDAIKQEALQALKKLKWIGIIAGIVMIVLGIIMFINPIEGVGVLLWMMVIGLLIYGIVNILLYVKLPVGIRDGSNLGMGVLWVIISGFMIYAGLTSTDLEKEIIGLSYSTFISVMLSFSCIFAGVEAFMTCGLAEEAGHSPVWNIISGILLLIAGMIIMSAPIGASIAINIIFGLFSVIGGVRLICRAASF